MLRDSQVANVAKKGEEMHQDFRIWTVNHSTPIASLKALKYLL